ncbi:MAG: hypothetical protein ACPG06_10900 [Alphaproteobacteria bacterium]
MSDIQLQQVDPMPLKIAAWCYIAAIVITPSLVIAPLVLYLQRDSLTAAYPGHYEFLMRTFWLSLIGLLLVGMASALGGPLGFVIWVVWLVGRGWVTLSHIAKNEDQADPKHLWWA